MKDNQNCNFEWKEHLEKNKLLMILLEPSIQTILIEGEITEISHAYDDWLDVSLKNKENLYTLERTVPNLWFLYRNGKELTSLIHSKESNEFNKIVEGFDWGKFLN